MLRRSTEVVASVAAGVVVLLAVLGCGTGALTPAAAYKPTSDGLNAVTAGDAAEAFRGFVGDVQAQRGEERGPLLTDEERGQIERLQDQLDNGEITAEQFATQVDTIIGDLAPRLAFAGFNFFGSAHGQRFGDRIATRLELTEEQRSAAREVFQNTHHQIRVLGLTAIANIRLALTDEQRAKLEELSADRFASIRSQQEPIDPASIGRGGIRQAVRSFFDRLASELGITDEQRQAIRSIRDEFRDAVRTMHHTARDAFQALLTDAQRAILDEIEARIREAHDRG